MSLFIKNKINKVINLVIQGTTPLYFKALFNL